MRNIVRSLILLCLWPLLATAGVVYQHPDCAVLMPANTWGTARTWGHPVNKQIEPGCAYAHKIPALDEAWLSYWLRLEPGWIEGEGGKFPGLGGGSATVGCDRASPDGWSARYMWDPMRLYLYTQGRQATCGDSVSLGIGPLAVGVWHRFIQHVRVNTPGVADGFIETIIDSRLVQRTGGLRLRGNVSPHTARVDVLVFNIMRGGKGDQWSVPRDTQVSVQSIYVLNCPPILAGDEHDVPRCGADDEAAAVQPLPLDETQNPDGTTRQDEMGVFRFQQAQQARQQQEMEEMQRAQQPIQDALDRLKRTTPGTQERLDALHALQNRMQERQSPSQ